MKILQVTPVFYPAFGDGGPVTALWEMCRSLATMGCNVRVLTTDAHGWDKTLDVETDKEIELQSNLRVRYCRRLLSRSVSPTLLRLLPQYIRWADIVHLQSVYNFPTIPTLILCSLFKRPVMWSPDGALQRWDKTRRTRLKSIWERICRIIAPRNLVLHATSEQEAKESLTSFPYADVVTIPHGIEIPEQVTRLESSGVLRILYLGRLDPKKGIENLLGACKIVQDRSLAAWTLTIAGAGNSSYTRHLGNCICNLGLQHQVRMVGQVIGKEKEQLFQQADVVVVPSYTENFGMVVVEALARAIPVIASTGTPWSKIAEIGCGLWVENDPESLAKAIERISHMPLRGMGQRGRQWAKECFSGEKAARDMIEGYEAVSLGSAIIPVKQNAKY